MNRVLTLILILGIVSSAWTEAVTPKGYYWIDTDPPVEFTEPPTEVVVSHLHDGWHTFNAVAYNTDGKYSVPVSSGFLKVSALNNSEIRSIAYIDGIMTTEPTFKSLGNDDYICDIDMNHLSAGVHNLQMILVTPSGSVSEVLDAWFFRMPSELELQTTSVAYFIDGMISGTQSLTYDGTTFLADIDTKSLNTGIHSIDISLILADGTMTPYQSAWFYKTPVPAGIVSYEYWFDDYAEDIRYFNLEEAVSDFNLITMVDVPQLPLDSRHYAFSVNNGIPVMFGKHYLNMHFYESDGRPLFQTSSFSEDRFPISINPDILKEGRNDIAERNDNEIKWFTFDGEIGDSIVLNLTRSAMYELYSPSGQELLRKKGSQTETETSTTLRETGKFYLAAHDVVNDRTAPFSINFQHIPRNAILTVNPSAALSDGRFSLFDLFGNGMSDAKKFILESADGTRFETDSVFAYDNYHLSAVITPDDSIPSGKYDVSMVITDAISGDDVIITKKEAVSVGSSSGKSNITVQVVPTRKAATPYMVDIIVTNDSDYPCWGVPFNILCERNHGKNGFVFYMSDFLGDPIAASHINWYESENIFGTGNDGVFFPVTLSYMHPHEKRKLRVGIISDPHAHVGLYAWAGTPYSEESRELLSTPADSLNAKPVPFTNIFDLRTAAYVASVLDETIVNTPVKKPGSRASSDDNRILEIAREYGPDAIGHYKPLERPSGYADQAAKIAENYGRTETGIVNSGAGYHCYMYFKYEEHIPGNTLGEQVKNIEAMYPGAPESIPPGALQIYYQQAKRTLGRGHSPQDLVEDTFGKEWGPLARLFIGRNAESCNPMPTRNDIDVYMSGDPNNLTGYVDPSGGNAIGCHVKTLDYTIEFENDSELASVPASKIIITNSLDSDVFDLKSFTPGELRIGSYTVTLPAEHNFVKTIDMRPERECIAEVRLDFSEETGKAVWAFNSLDPTTLQPIIDARQGLLPVNDADGNGIGTITYDIALRKGLSHGTSISNSASIIFDENDAIQTPEWTNVTDYEFPKADLIGEQPYEGNAYQINVDLKDEGSGVMSYDLYIKTDSQDSWRVGKSGITDSHTQFETPEPIPGIKFMTLATDRAGNRQIIDNPESPTEVGTVTIDEDHENWFDTQGVKLNNHKNRFKGVYISTKGRKVIVK